MPSGLPANTIRYAGHALRWLAGDAALRQTMGRWSRASMRDRGYEPSVDAFVATVLEAVAR